MGMFLNAKIILLKQLLQLSCSNILIKIIISGVIDDIKAAKEQSGKNPLVFCMVVCEVISGSRKSSKKSSKFDSIFFVFKLF